MIVQFIWVKANGHDQHAKMERIMLLKVGFTGWRVLSTCCVYTLENMIMLRADKKGAGPSVHV